MKASFQEIFPSRSRVKICCRVPFVSSPFPFFPSAAAVNVALLLSICISLSLSVQLDHIRSVFVPLGSNAHGQCSTRFPFVLSAFPPVLLPHRERTSSGGLSRDERTLRASTRTSSKTTFRESKHQRIKRHKRNRKNAERERDNTERQRRNREKLKNEETKTRFGSEPTRERAGRASPGPRYNRSSNASAAHLCLWRLGSHGVWRLFRSHRSVRSHGDSGHGQRNH